MTVYRFSRRIISPHNDLTAPLRYRPPEMLQTLHNWSIEQDIDSRQTI